MLLTRHFNIDNLVFFILLVCNIFKVVNLLDVVDSSTAEPQSSELDKERLDFSVSKFKCGYKDKCLSFNVLEPPCYDGYLTPQIKRPGYVKVTLGWAWLCDQAHSNMSDVTPPNLAWFWASSTPRQSRHLVRCRNSWMCMVPVAAVEGNRSWLEIGLCSTNDLPSHNVNATIAFSLRLQPTQDDQKVFFHEDSTQTKISTHGSTQIHQNSEEYNDLVKSKIPALGFKEHKTDLKLDIENKISSSVSSEVYTKDNKPVLFSQRKQLSKLLKKIRKIINQYKRKHNSLFNLNYTRFRSNLSQKDGQNVQNASNITETQKLSSSHTLDNDRNDNLNITYVRFNSTQLGENLRTQAHFHLGKDLSKKGYELLGDRVKQNAAHSRRRNKRNIRHVSDDEAADLAILMEGENSKDKEKISAMIASDFESTEGLSDPLVKPESGRERGLLDQNEQDVERIEKLIDELEEEEDDVQNNVPSHPEDKVLSVLVKPGSKKHLVQLKHRIQTKKRQLVHAKKALMDAKLQVVAADARDIPQTPAEMIVVRDNLKARVASLETDLRSLQETYSDLVEENKLVESPKKKFHGVVEIDPVWSLWSAWSSCSSDCSKGGYSVRKRECDTLPSVPCVGDDFDMKPCNNISCEDKWQSWSDWGPCSATCGRGVRTRSRVCLSSGDDQSITCPGSPTATMVCDQVPCDKVDERDINLVQPPPAIAPKGRKRGKSNIPKRHRSEGKHKNRFKRKRKGRDTRILNKILWSEKNETVTMKNHIGKDSRDLGSDIQTSDADIDVEVTTEKRINEKNISVPNIALSSDRNDTSYTSNKISKDFRELKSAIEDLPADIDQGVMTQQGIYQKNASVPTTASTNNNYFQVKRKQQLTRGLPVQPVLRRIRRRTSYVGRDGHVAPLIVPKKYRDKEPSILDPHMWGVWGPWSECSAKCGAGMQFRSRLCINYRYKKAKPAKHSSCFPGVAEQSKPCVGKICAGEAPSGSAGAAAVLAAQDAALASQVEEDDPFSGTDEDETVAAAEAVAQSDPANAAAIAAVAQPLGAAVASDGDIPADDVDDNDEEEEEEEDDEIELTGETIAFIVLLFIVLVLIITAFCIWFSSRYQDARMRQELAEAVPFYNLQADDGDSGGGAERLEGPSRGVVKPIVRVPREGGHPNEHDTELQHPPDNHAPRPSVSPKAKHGSKDFGKTGGKTIKKKKQDYNVRYVTGPGGVPESVLARLVKRGKLPPGMSQSDLSGAGDVTVSMSDMAFHRPKGWVEGQSQPVSLSSADELKNSQYLLNLKKEGIRLNKNGERSQAVTRLVDPKILRKSRSFPNLQNFSSVSDATMRWTGQGLAPPRSGETRQTHPTVKVSMSDTMAHKRSNDRGAQSQRFADNLGKPSRRKNRAITGKDSSHRMPGNTRQKRTVGPRHSAKSTEVPLDTSTRRNETNKEKGGGEYVVRVSDGKPTLETVASVKQQTSEPQSKLLKGNKTAQSIPVPNNLSVSNSSSMDISQSASRYECNNSSSNTWLSNLLKETDSHLGDIDRDIDSVLSEFSSLRQSRLRPSRSNTSVETSKGWLSDDSVNMCRRVETQKSAGNDKDKISQQDKRHGSSSDGKSSVARSTSDTEETIDRSVSQSTQRSSSYDTTTQIEQSDTERSTSYSTYITEASQTHTSTSESKSKSLQQTQSLDTESHSTLQHKHKKKGTKSTRNDDDEDNDEDSFDMPAVKKGQEKGSRGSLCNEKRPAKCVEKGAQSDQTVSEQTGCELLSDTEGLQTMSDHSLVELCGDSELDQSVHWSESERIIRSQKWCGAETGNSQKLSVEEKHCEMSEKEASVNDEAQKMQRTEQSVYSENSQTSDNRGKSRKRYTLPSKENRNAFSGASEGTSRQSNIVNCGEGDNMDNSVSQSQKDVSWSLAKLDLRKGRIMPMVNQSFEGDVNLEARGEPSEVSYQVMSSVEQSFQNSQNFQAKREECSGSMIKEGHHSKQEDNTAGLFDMPSHSAAEAGTYEDKKRQVMLMFSQGVGHDPTSLLVPQSTASVDRQASQAEQNDVYKCKAQAEEAPKNSVSMLLGISRTNAVPTLKCYKPPGLHKNTQGISCTPNGQGIGTSKLKPNKKLLSGNKKIGQREVEVVSLAMNESDLEHLQNKVSSQPRNTALESTEDKQVLEQNTAECGNPLDDIWLSERTKELGVSKQIDTEKQVTRIAQSSSNSTQLPRKSSNDNPLSFANNIAAINSEHSTSFASHNKQFRPQQKNTAKGLGKQNESGKLQVSLLGKNKICGSEQARFNPSPLEARSCKDFSAALNKQLDSFVGSSLWASSRKGQIHIDWEKCSDARRRRQQEGLRRVPINTGVSSHASDPLSFGVGLSGKAESGKVCSQSREKMQVSVKDLNRHTEGQQGMFLQRPGDHQGTNERLSRFGNVTSTNIPRGRQGNTQTDSQRLIRTQQINCGNVDAKPYSENSTEGQVYSAPPLGSVSYMSRGSLDLEAMTWPSSPARQQPSPNNTNSVIKSSESSYSTGNDDISSIESWISFDKEGASQQQSSSLQTDNTSASLLSSDTRKDKQNTWRKFELHTDSQQSSETSRVRRDLPKTIYGTSGGRPVTYFPRLSQPYRVAKDVAMTTDQYSHFRTGNRPEAHFSTPAVQLAATQSEVVSSPGESEYLSCSSSHSVVDTGNFRDMQEEAGTSSAEATDRTEGFSYKSQITNNEFESEKGSKLQWAFKKPKHTDGIVFDKIGCAGLNTTYKDRGLSFKQYETQKTSPTRRYVSTTDECRSPSDLSCRSTLFASDAGTDFHSNLGTDYLSDRGTEYQSDRGMASDRGTEYHSDKESVQYVEYGSGNQPRKFHKNERRLEEKENIYGIYEQTQSKHETENLSLIQSSHEETFDDMPSKSHKLIDFSEEVSNKETKTPPSATYINSQDANIRVTPQEMFSNSVKSRSITEHTITIDVDNSSASKSDLNIVPQVNTYALENKTDTDKESSDMSCQKHSFSASNQLSDGNRSDYSKSDNGSLSHTESNLTNSESPRDNTSQQINERRLPKAEDNDINHSSSQLTSVSRDSPDATKILDKASVATDNTHYKLQSSPFFSTTFNTENKTDKASERISNNKMSPLVSSTTSPLSNSNEYENDKKCSDSESQCSTQPSVEQREEKSCSLEASGQSNRTSILSIEEITDISSSQPCHINELTKQSEETTSMTSEWKTQQTDCLSNTVSKKPGNHADVQTSDDPTSISFLPQCLDGVYSVEIFLPKQCNEAPSLSTIRTSQTKNVLTPRSELKDSAKSTEIVPTNKELSPSGLHLHSASSLTNSTEENVLKEGNKSACAAATQKIVSSLNRKSSPSDINKSLVHSGKEGQHIFDTENTDTKMKDNKMSINRSDKLNASIVENYVKDGGQQFAESPKLNRSITKSKVEQQNGKMTSDFSAAMSDTYMHNPRIVDGFDTSKSQSESQLPQSTAEVIVNSNKDVTISSYNLIDLESKETNAKLSSSIQSAENCGLKNQEDSQNSLVDLSINTQSEKIHNTNMSKAIEKHISNVEMLRGLTIPEKNREDTTSECLNSKRRSVRFKSYADQPYAQAAFKVESKPTLVEKRVSEKAKNKLPIPKESMPQISLSADRSNTSETTESEKEHESGGSSSIQSKLSMYGSNVSTSVGSSCSESECFEPSTSAESESVSSESFNSPSSRSGRCLISSCSGSSKQGFGFVDVSSGGSSERTSDIGNIKSGIYPEDSGGHKLNRECRTASFLLEDNNKIMSSIAEDRGSCTKPSLLEDHDNLKSKIYKDIEDYILHRGYHATPKFLEDQFRYDSRVDPSLSGSRPCTSTMFDSPVCSVDQRFVDVSPTSELNDSVEFSFKSMVTLQPDEFRESPSACLAKNVLARNENISHIGCEESVDGVSHAVGVQPGKIEYLPSGRQRGNNNNTFETCFKTSYLEESKKILGHHTKQSAFELVGGKKSSAFVETKTSPTYPEEQSGFSKYSQNVNEMKPSRNNSISNCTKQATCLSSKNFDGSVDVGPVASSKQGSSSYPQAHASYEHISCSSLNRDLSYTNSMKNQELSSHRNSQTNMRDSSSSSENFETSSSDSPGDGPQTQCLANDSSKPDIYWAYNSQSQSDSSSSSMPSSVFLSENASFINQSNRSYVSLTPQERILYQDQSNSYANSLEFYISASPYRETLSDCISESDQDFDNPQALFNVRNETAKKQFNNSYQRQTSRIHHFIQPEDSHQQAEQMTDLQSRRYHDLDLTPSKHQMPEKQTCADTHPPVDPSVPHFHVDMNAHRQSQNYYDISRHLSQDMIHQSQNNVTAEQTIRSSMFDRDTSDSFQMPQYSGPANRRDAILATHSHHRSHPTRAASIHTHICRKSCSKIDQE